MSKHWSKHQHEMAGSLFALIEVLRVTRIISKLTATNIVGATTGNYRILVFQTSRRLYKERTK